LSSSLTSPMCACSSRSTSNMIPGAPTDPTDIAVSLWLSNGTLLGFYGTIGAAMIATAGAGLAAMTLH
jgi:hypothetical protein